MALISDPVSAVAGLVSGVIARVWPDPVEREKAQAALEAAKQSGALAEVSEKFRLDLEQARANTAEARSSSVWVAGWRPAVGWICAGALAWQWIVLPLLQSAAALLHFAFVAPAIDAARLDSLLMALLGLGSLHTVENVKGARHL